VIRLSEEELKKIGFSETDLENIQKKKEVNAHILIRAPVSGSIVGNMVHIGEMVKADQALYHIVPLDELWFNAQVFEMDLGLLKLGQTIRISTKSFPGQSFPGKLTFIGRTLDESNRTVPVRFTISNKDRRLLPNLSASGRLEIPISEDVPSVPNSAVLDLGTRHVVYIEKEEGVYIARNVRIGHVTQHYTQIVEGISEKDKIVSAGAFLVDAQSQLRAGTGAMTPGTEPGAQEPMTPTPNPPAHHH
jgi:Cu(I)/Ag(I) efflux system membrane fusion protein